MEDLFDNTRDRWQKSFRHPLYLRFLWLLGVAIVVVAVLFRERLHTGIAKNAIVGWATVGGIAFLAFCCFWTSMRAWECKILISPTSIKAWYLFQGRERISWDKMDRVVYKWRLIGYTIMLVGTDGAKVRIRSALKGFDEIIGFIRTKAPEHIVKQLDEILEEPEEEDAEDAKD